MSHLYSLSLPSVKSTTGDRRRTHTVYTGTSNITTAAHREIIFRLMQQAFPFFGLILLILFKCGNMVILVSYMHSGRSFIHIWGREKFQQKELCPGNRGDKGTCGISLCFHVTVKCWYVCEMYFLAYFKSVLWMCIFSSIPITSLKLHLFIW